GKWILYPRYIHDSYKANKWLYEKEYELPKYNFAARYQRMGRVNRAGAGIYKNIRVYIKLAEKSHARAFRRVMAAGEAEILLKEDIRRANLVITDMQHYEIISQQLPTNSNIVGTDFIKDTLVHQKSLDSIENYYLKKAARYQGTPRKNEAGSSTQGTHATTTSNTGYTPIKMIHRIKKEPEDGTTAVKSPSNQMRKSLKKIPFTPQNYKNISMYFKTESKEKIKKTDPAEKASSTLNQSIEIIEDKYAIQRQNAHVMPSSSKHYQSEDGLEITWEKPNKKRKDSVCEIVDVDDVEMIPVTTKPQGIIIKEEIDLTHSLKKVTVANQSTYKNTPIIPMMIVSPRLVCVSPRRDHSITSAISAPSRTSLESPEVSSKSVRDPVSPVISTIKRNYVTRRVSTPNGGSSHNKECISRIPSSLSPVPTYPISPSSITESPGSSSGMSLGGTPSNLSRSLSKAYSEMSQHSNNTKQSDVSEEGEMEISCSSGPLDSHPLGMSTNRDMDLVSNLGLCDDSDASGKRPSPQKVARKPLLPIDLSNCLDTTLSQSENRSAPVVIRKKKMNDLILSFMHKQNHISRTVFSDTIDLCAHNDVEKNLQKSTPPREMSVKQTALYESSLDDTLKVNRQTIKEKEIIVQGIEYLYLALTPEAFPPPKILGHLLRRLVWLENRFPIIHSRALTLVYRILDFHPPSCTQTRTLYLTTLRYAGSTEEQDAVNNSWTFIKEIMNSALDMDMDEGRIDSSSDSSGGDDMIYKSMNSVRLLDFIQTLLQEDLRHWDN
ncbi:unnamed protein product, partial [Meganyctiphanes norvegica]